MWQAELRSWGGTNQYGETGQEIVDKDDAADQVRDLQRRLQRLRSINGRSALPLGVLHHDGGDVEFVLVGVVARLDGEGLKESDADADDAHGHAAPDQQKKAHAKTQADLGHDEAAVGGVEAVLCVMPAHCRERGQDERHHPDPHHRVHRLLLGVAQPGRTPTDHVKLDVCGEVWTVSIKRQTSFPDHMVSFKFQPHFENLRHRLLWMLWQWGCHQRSDRWENVSSDPGT